MALFTDPQGRYAVVEPESPAHERDPALDFRLSDEANAAIDAYLVVRAAAAHIARATPVYVCLGHRGLFKTDICAHTFHHGRPDVCSGCGRSHRRADPGPVPGAAGLPDESRAGPAELA